MEADLFADVRPVLALAASLASSPAPRQHEAGALGVSLEHSSLQPLPASGGGPSPLVLHRHQPVGLLLTLRQRQACPLPPHATPPPITLDLLPPHRHVSSSSPLTQLLHGQEEEGGSGGAVAVTRLPGGRFLLRFLADGPEAGAEGDGQGQELRVVVRVGGVAVGGPVVLPLVASSPWSTVLCGGGAHQHARLLQLLPRHLHPHTLRYRASR